MASNAPGQCCVTGMKHEGEPTGKSLKIDGYDAYLATAHGPRAHEGVALLLLTDVIGIWQNSKLVADQYASYGYTTLIIDIFNGDALTLNRADNFDFFAWLKGGSTGDNPHTSDAIDPIVKSAVKYLKEAKGATAIGAAGYCFGAKYVVRHSPDIKVGFIAHPSFVEETELESFEGPLSVAAAEKDDIFSAEKRHLSEQILAKKGLPYQMSLYSQVEHGFGLRADHTKKISRFAKEQAFYQAIAWFDAWLV
ncbi:unnamed protein product [Clonostachys byssicola]|uniref:Dienelactone hydrolase domain-containing protein n=1 Tax=Clonostachys byssicola TaxID=160290 RepID=A0A9N9Y155_9HYPO|nr:unnamed protein product [Clonostachys byssicola]